MLALSKGSPELALSRSTWHYPRVDLDQHRAKLAISKGGFGPNFGKVGTIQGWIWAKIGQGGHYRTCWHYPRVDLGQIWAKLALSKGGFGSKLGKVGTIQGWIWPKIGQGGHYRTCWHYPRVDLGPKWSILVTIDTFKGGSGRPGSKSAKVSQDSNANLNFCILRLESMRLVRWKGKNGGGH